MKKLLIVESPSKAKTIQKYLGDEYIVKSTRGHIADLSSNGANKLGIDLKNGFKPRYSVLPDKLSILDELINATETCDEILLFMDNDREGAAISLHLRDRLISCGKPIYRGTFNEITKSGILSAIKNKGDIDLNLCKAQEARRILDRIVGYMASPYANNFYGIRSIGRVQSVAVRMISDREKEIDSFKPEEYWNIFANFITENNIDFVSKYDGIFKTENDAKIIEDAVSSTEDFLVSDVKKQVKKEKPIAPLTTSTLQQGMAKIYGFDADRTMKAAQSLYENGYCTYIRTDSVRSSSEAIESARKWLKTNKYDIPSKPNEYATKDSAQDAHECIRPTNINTLSTSEMFVGDEKLVYGFIWRAFLASQMNPAIRNLLTITISSKTNNKLKFKSSGRSLEYKGYLQMLGNPELSKIDLPDLTKNQPLKYKKNSLKKEQKFSQPPPRFNNASILKELETRQIGRPSTYAYIIKTISDRKYVEYGGNTFKPTELGNKITQIFGDSFSFMNYDFTSKLEDLLDKIASGESDRTKVLQEFYDIFIKELNIGYTANLNNSHTCKKCGYNMIQKEGKFGKFFLCINYACGNTETGV
jgi:DNA topoisomerase-1